MVLSACSPYFQCLLNDAPCSHPVIILQGVKWIELKAVVEFMYKGEINICQEQLGSLLRVAESLKIRGLAEVDGDGAEPAVLASPSVSPAARAPSIDDSSPSSGVSRKRRRHSGDDASRPCTPLTPISAPELMDGLLELPASFMRNTIPTPLPSSPAGLNSLATRLPGPMPPPAPMPPHLPHLPPLSPLLNMHTLPRPHAPDDFEIRPGIAEMIREEERVSTVVWSLLCASSHVAVQPPHARSASRTVRLPRRWDFTLDCRSEERERACSPRTAGMTTTLIIWRKVTLSAREYGGKKLVVGAGGMREGGREAGCWQAARGQAGHCSRSHTRRLQLVSCNCEKIRRIKTERAGSSLTVRAWGLRRAVPCQGGSGARRSEAARG
ncbi:Protein bric-a-brac 2 [Portunus trituberculatus]|uniref:Protein bric-a-brac 2 n=1 Tax=Portunus trituberculatus TaxID=210409 RepID=A0A5B7EEN6_PORTR|nr:Protein bric-a-brac 2 [Portunus trituberculatus]